MRGPIEATSGEISEGNRMDVDEVERLSTALFLSDQRKGCHAKNVLWDHSAPRLRAAIGDDTHHRLNEEEREKFRNRVRAGERATDD